MEKEIVAGALFLLALISPTPNTFPASTSPTQQEEMKVYAVQKEDTLGSIAKTHYGSPDFWTNLWNDNSWIENPDIIEKDWKLNISEKSDKPEELKKELSEKLMRKNIAYASSQAKINIQAQIEPIQPQVTIDTVPSVKPASTVTTGPLSEAQINFLGSCESGMRPATNTGNGYYGAFQFTIGTWNSMGTGYERADLAPLDVQIGAVQRLVTRSSIFGQFPACSARMRAAGLL